MNESLASPHQYIAIEGPIGVGKTSLARRLAATYGSELMLEDAASNPFLKRFYRNPQQGALPTQLFFLFQRIQQLEEIRQDDIFTPVRVADFILEKDRLFAELTLDEDELKLYLQVYEKMAIEVRQPDLVIYLQAPIDILRRRIARRGIDYEQSIDTDYLSRLIDMYTRFFHNYQRVPLLIVNAAEIDLVDNDEEYRQLIERISNIHSGRHYYNPMPISV